MSDQRLGPLTTFDAVFQADHIASIVVKEAPSSVLPIRAGLAEAVLAVARSVLAIKEAEVATGP